MAKKSKASKRRRKNLSRKNRNKRSTETVAYELLEPKHLLAAITVGNLTDLSNAPDTSSIAALIANDGGDGISLREAIAATNNTTGEDTITFDTSAFTGGDNSLIRLTQGQLQIFDSLTIDGTSVGGVVVTGDVAGDDVTVGTTNITDVSASFGGTAGAAGDLLDDNSRVLNVSGTGNLTLTDLTITGGRTTGQVQGGAGIRFSSSGTLTLNDSTLSGNSTTGELSSGGGIITISGDVSLVNSTVSGNSTTGDRSQGGGIRNISGAVSLVNSTLSGNSTTGDSSDGGGIANYSGDVSLVNSTLSGNSAAGIGSDGGGIWSFRSTVEMVNSTVTGNSTLGGGGGISFDVSSNGAGRLTLHNTIVAGNTDIGFAPDVEAVGNVMTSLIVENSLIGDITGSGIDAVAGSGNILNEAALLGPLANNGGSTQTHALMSGSVAINGGSNALAAGLLTDQRGEDRISGGTVDIGSYEIPIELVSIVVTTDSDIVDATDSETSLREAINLANNTAGLDMITFDTSVFTILTDNVIRLTQGELVISENLSIDATSVDGIVITGDANDNDVTIGNTNITEVSGLFDDLMEDNSRVLNVSGTGDLALTNLTITGGGNTVSRVSGGGGILFDSIGTLTLNDSTVSGNIGGGVYTDSGDVSLVNSTVSGNISLENGGGIRTDSGDVSLVNSTLSGNSSLANRILFFDIAGRLGGGGIFNRSGDVSLINSTLSDNTAFANGGGILNGGDVSLVNSTLSGNSTGEFGGGIFSYGSGSTVEIVNSTLSGNSAEYGGGGIYSDGPGSTLEIVNSTVTGNTTFRNEGGGISLERTSLTLHNSIVAGNTDINGIGNGFAPDVDVNLTTPNLIVENSLIGNTAGSGIDAATGSGNILDRPALLGPLADNGGPTLTHALLSGSPAIDAGNNDLAVDANGAALGIDQRGGNSTRIFDDPTAPGTGVDIGAFELRDVLVDNRVDENDGIITAGNLSLREAISLVNADTITFDTSVFTGGNNSVIRLTQGELVISETLNIDATSVGGVVITGDANDDDVTVGGSQITDVSASLGVSDDNSRVLNVSGTGDLTLTGLTITGGAIDVFQSGGGILFNSSGTLTLNDSTLSGNSTVAYGTGGGISTFSGNVSLVNSTLSGNMARGGAPYGEGDGGGVFTFSGDVSLVNSTLSGNSATGGGGGISTRYGDVSLLNSTLGGNSTNGRFSNGGGINTSFGDVSLVDSTLSGNSTDGIYSDGGGIFTTSGAVSLVNSTLSGNSITGRNTGLYNSGGGGGVFTTSGAVSLVDSTLSGNSSTGLGGGIYTRSGAVSLDNSTLSGNSSTGRGGGVYTRSGAVSLDNSTLSGNSSTGTYGDGGGISTLSGDVSLVNSTLSGNSITGDTSSGGGIQTFSSNVSLVNSTVTGNSTSGIGGGISFNASSDGAERLTLHNSIVAGNTDNGTAPDVEVSVNVTNDPIVENSLIGDTTGSGIDAATGTGNILNVDPLLGPLADNGGPTLTHALLPGSPAIDAGNNALALDENGNPLTTDQRGETRIESGTVDIGSVESESEGPFLLGDADLSGVVDFADIPALIAVLIGGTFLDEADVNRDGIVDFADIPAFIDVLINGGPPEVLLGDADLSGVVDFADIPAFIDVLIGGTFLDEADIDRNGVVDFSDIPAFIDVLISGGSSAVTSQSIVVAPPVSSAASLVSVIESELIASVASTVEVPLTSETSDAIVDPAGSAELVEYDSLEPVEATDPTEIVPTEIVAPTRNVPDQIVATAPASIEASQLSTAESLPPLVAPQFNATASNLPIAPVVASAEEDRLLEQQAVSSSTPLSLVGGLASFESRVENRQFPANDSEPDQQETGEVDLLDETFATYEDDLDAVFS